MDLIQILLTGKHLKTQARFWLCGRKVLLCSLLHVQKARESCCDLIAVEKLLRRWQHSPKGPLCSFGVESQPEDSSDTGEHNRPTAVNGPCDRQLGWEAKWTACVLGEAGKTPVSGDLTGASHCCCVQWKHCRGDFLDQCLQELWGSQCCDTWSYFPPRRSSAGCVSEKRSALHSSSSFNCWVTCVPCGQGPMSTNQKIPRQVLWGIISLDRMMKDRIGLLALGIKCFCSCFPHNLVVVLPGRIFSLFWHCPYLANNSGQKHLFLNIQVNCTPLPRLRSWWPLPSSSCPPPVSDKRGTTSQPQLGFVSRLKHSPRGHFTFLSEPLYFHHTSSTRANAQWEP